MATPVRSCQLSAAVGRPSYRTTSGSSGDDGGDPGAARVPLAGRGRQHGADPLPAQPVAAGGVRRRHPVLVPRVGQGVLADPGVPAARVVDQDHRVLDRDLVVAGQHDGAAAARAGPRDGRRRGPRSTSAWSRAWRRTGRAASRRRRAEHHRPLERLGAELVAVDLADRLEDEAVAAARHHGRDAATLGQRTPHAVGQVGDVAVLEGARRAGPVAGTGVGSGDDDAGVAHVEQGKGGGRHRKSLPIHTNLLGERWIPCRHGRQDRRDRRRRPRGGGAAGRCAGRRPRRAARDASTPSTAQPLVEPDVAATAPPDPEPDDRLLPDLRSLDAFDLRIEATPAGRRLRFAAALANDGPGPLVLKPRDRRDCDPGEHAATQILFVDGDGDGRFRRDRDERTRRQFAGCMLRHRGHDHWHFDAMAAYSLRRPDADPHRSPSAAR